MRTLGVEARADQYRCVRPTVPYPSRSQRTIVSFFLRLLEWPLARSLTMVRHCRFTLIFRSLKSIPVAAVPYGLTIQRIKAITLFFGAWVGTLEVTYLLSDGSEMTRTNGQRGKSSRLFSLIVSLSELGSGGKSATYQFRPNEILIAVAGLLGFIQVRRAGSN